MIRTRTPDPVASNDITTSEFKKYEASMDRVLASFDAIETWPDHVTFLSRLLKCIQSHPTITSVPRKLDVSGRLSLCLVATLPSGVQQKALQLYSHIFSLLGRDLLSQELAIWLPGLIPILNYAGSTLKMHFIDLMSMFIIPLGTQLHRFSKALIQSVLPGLEDDQDEAFDACINLMEELRNSFTGGSRYWDSFWLATMAATSAQKSGALNYLLRKMPRAASSVLPSADEGWLGSDVGLFVRAFAAGLTDPNILVQRGFLELLVTNLPLSSSPIRNLIEVERRRLFQAAIQIVLRKEVSLNKRLWIWLLGPIPEPEQFPEDTLDQTYFDLYAFQTLSDVLAENICSNPVSTLKIFLSLLDRNQIGGRLITQFFPSFIDASYRQCLHGEFHDIAVSAQALFEATPLDLVVSHIVQLCIDDEYNKAEFMLNTFNFHDEDFSLDYIPEIFLSLLAAKGTKLSALTLALKFVELIPDSALSQATTNIRVLDGDLTLGALKEKYSNTRGSEGLPKADVESLGKIWIILCCELLKSSSSNAQILYILLQKRLSHGQLTEELSRMILDFVAQLLRPDRPTLLSFIHLCGVVDLICALDVHSLHDYPATRDLSYSLCEQCWHYLGSKQLRYEVSSVGILGQLSNFLDMETFVTMHVSRDLKTSRPIEKFVALWKHFNETMKIKLLHKSSILVLDALAFSTDNPRSHITRWLSLAVADTHLLVQFLFEDISRPLRKLECLITTMPKGYLRGVLAPLTYYIRLLEALLQYGGSSLQQHLHATIMPGNGAVFDAVGILPEANQYLETIKSLAKVVLAKAPMESPDCHVDFRSLFLSIVSVVRTLYSSAEYFDDLELIFVVKLKATVDISSFDLQHLILTAMGSFHYLDKSRRSAEEQINLASVKSLPGSLLTIALEGLNQSRGSPTLQTWLRFLNTRMSTGSEIHQAAIYQVTQCIIENIDLNLIDIDAVLTTDPQSSTDTTLENILVMLEALENLGLSLLLDGKQLQAIEHQTHPSNPVANSLFGNAFTFVSNAPEERPISSVRPGDVEIFQSILRLATSTYLWAVDVARHELPSICYISKTLKLHSFRIIKRIYKDGSMDALDTIISIWHGATLQQRKWVQQLCQELNSPEEGSGLITLLLRNLKTRITFTSSSPRNTPDQVQQVATFFLNSLEFMQSDNFATTLPEIVAFLRHLSLHTPTTRDTDLILLQLVSVLSSKILTTIEGQQKRQKREIADVVLKIYNAAIVLHDDRESESKTLHSQALCDVLSLKIIPQLPRIFLDLDRIFSALSIIMANVVQPHFKSKMVNKPCLECLESMSKLENVKKAWKKDVTEYFGDPAFFLGNGEIAHGWASIFRSLLMQGKDKINEYLQKPNPNAPGNLLTSSDTEKQFKIHQNRRLVFLLMAMPRDSYLAKVSLIKEKFLELARAKSSSRLISEAFLLLRAALLRISAEHLEQVWPILVTELQRTFRELLAMDDPCDRATDVILPAIKTLDLLLYLAPDGFQSDASAVEHSHVSDSAIGSLAAKVGNSFEGPQFHALAIVLDHIESISLGSYIRNISLLNYERIYQDTRSRAVKGQTPEWVDESIWEDLFSN